MANTLGEIIESLKETPKVEKWEYKIEYFDIDDIDKGTLHLNYYGEIGWELVQIYKGCGIFKRKIQQSK